MTVSTLVLFFFAVLRGTASEGGLQAEHKPGRTCTSRGNLNLDTGQCDCPWGYGGPACNTLLFPACRLSLSPNATTWTCDSGRAQNCACFSQCWRFYCGSDHDSLQERCETPMWTNHMARCYEYAGVPEEEQISDAPDPSDPRARYYEGIFDNEFRRKVDRQVATKLWWGDVDVVPMSSCPFSCFHRGHCTQDRNNPKADRICLCHYGFEGAVCERETDEMCYNNCSGNGECMRGFCHCKPGWWGIDCSRSRSYLHTQSFNTTRPPINRLRIYMYDLPNHAAHDYSNNDPIYIAYKKFLSIFLRDWSVRTENPYEANMFFIPALLYYYSSNTAIASTHLERVVRYVQREFPFWNRTRGADHFFFATQDRGLCHYHMEEVLQDSIRLVHFGYYQFNNTLRGMEGKMEACIKPARDIVVTPNIPSALQMVQETFPELSPSKDLAELPARTKLLFLAGGVRFWDAEYSGGVRQAMMRLYNASNSSDPDVKFYEGGVPDYHEQLRSHKFCVAPWGHGWGIRLPQAMLHGCVPVIIQDHVYQYFEDVLPYQEFSVRLSFEDIPHLGQLLRNIGDAEYARLQKGVRRWYRAFYWDEAPDPLGGQAFNVTLRSLMKRLRYLKGKLIQPTKHCNLPPGQGEADPDTPPEEQQQQECPVCEDCPCQGPKGCPACPTRATCPADEPLTLEKCQVLVKVAGSASKHTWAASLQHANVQLTSFLRQNGLHAVYLALILLGFVAGMAFYSRRQKGRGAKGQQVPGRIVIAAEET